MLHRPPAEWKPRADRRKVSLSGFGARENGKTFRAHMSNLSYSGCKLLSDEPLDIGERITLAIPGMGTVIAQIRWGSDDTYGVRFILQESGVDARRARLGI